MKIHPLLDLAHEMMVVWRLNGQIWDVEYLNPAWRNNLGWTPEQMKQGEGLIDLVHPLDKEATLQALDSLLKLGSLIFTNRYRHTDGTYRWLHWECHCDKTRIYGLARPAADQQQPEISALVTVTPGGYINGWNRLSESLFGYQLWEALGESLSGFIDRAQVVIDAIKKNHPIEYLISPGRRKSGQPINLLLTLDIINQGRLNYGRLSVHDIAASIHNESYLATLLKRSSTIARIGGWVSDVDNNGLLVWGEGTFNLMGLDPSNFDNRVATFFDMIHPDDRAAVIAASEAAFRLEQKYSIDHRVILPSGEIRWLHEEADIILDAHGQPLQLVGTVQDITRQKLLDLALQDKEAWYRAVVGHISSIIITVDARGVLLYASPSLERNLGYNAEEVVGRKIINSIHPDDHARFNEHMAWIIAHPDTPKDVLLRVCTKGGQWCWYDVTFNNLLPQPGVEAIVINGRDVTERIVLEDQLRNEASALAWVNAELTEFAYVASHDMKEPLRTISVYLDIVLHSLEISDPDIVEAVGFIKAAVKRIQNLLEDLLAYSRVGSVAPVSKTINLPRLLAGVVGNLQGRIEQTQGRVTINPLPIVTGDPARLAQVFQNLISNALKFHRPNVPPLVEVGFNQPVFYVKDNGIGIPAKSHADIFRVFYRLHSFETYSGSGVGLAICKKIIEQHGGKIWVQSEPGQGSTFYFTLGETYGTDVKNTFSGGQ